VVEETVHLHPADNPDPNDATLKDRVESELFRDWTVPKGDISINVAESVVELRGQVEHPDDIDAIEHKVRQIEGVRVIHNYLHVPGTPAPNKARVLSVP
jgi:osmotically-inducible protein OsmY